MTNHTTKDARVAEIVGYTFYTAPNFASGEAAYNICWPPGSRQLPSKEDKHKSGYWYEKIDIADINFDLRFSTFPLPPFTTAPTHATDGIVLEWVQGQDLHFQAVFVGELVKVLSERQNEIQGHWALDSRVLDIAVCYYKPGMRAQALLASQEER